MVRTTGPWSDQVTPLVLDTPTPEGLGRVVAALGSWQSDAAPFQLHPGDLGWHLARGPEASAAVLRTWSRDGEIVAVGFLDGPDLMRFTTAPEVRRREAVAQHVGWVVGRSRATRDHGAEGVHQDHLGHGYGRAICIAAAAALQEMGASSAMVATRSANVAAVTTYAAAGYRKLPERRDQAHSTAG